MARPNAKAMPRKPTVVAPTAGPAMTAAPQPNRTSVNVPINSASILFINVAPPSRISLRGECSEFAAFAEERGLLPAEKGRGRGVDRERRHDAIAARAP